jgi:hypothetical protein
VTVVAVMEALVAVVVVQLTMFRDLVQDKAMDAGEVKLLTKAVLHQTATAMLDLAATVLLTQAVVAAAVGHIMAVVDRE